jgi:hypothetical protein
LAGSSDPRPDRYGAALHRPALYPADRNHRSGLEAGPPRTAPVIPVSGPGVTGDASGKPGWPQQRLRLHMTRRRSSTAHIGRSSSPLATCAFHPKWVTKGQSSRALTWACQDLISGEGGGAGVDRPHRRHHRPAGGVLRDDWGVVGQDRGNHARLAVGGGQHH